MPPKLFAIYLGGRATRCNTELHDVIFAVGARIEDTFEQVFHKWFGLASRVHIDSWLDLRIIDGYRITLSPTPVPQTKKLFFINLGAYLPGQFTELHANAFVVADDEAAVKSRAKKELLRGTEQLHTDDLYDIDDCLEVTEVGGWHVVLEPTTEIQLFEPNNGWLPLPKASIEDFLRRNPDRA